MCFSFLKNTFQLVKNASNYSHIILKDADYPSGSNTLFKTFISHRFSEILKILTTNVDKLVLFLFISELS